MSIKEVWSVLKDLLRDFKKTIFPSRLLAIDDTTAFTGLNGYAIQAITDTVISSLTTGGLDPDSTWDLTGVTISAGTIIYVQFSAITLTSGECICYLQ